MQKVQQPHKQYRRKKDDSAKDTDLAVEALSVSDGTSTKRTSNGKAGPLQTANVGSSSANPAEARSVTPFHDRSAITVLFIFLQVFLDLSLTILAFGSAFYLHLNSVPNSLSFTDAGREYSPAFGVLLICLLFTFKKYNLYRAKIGSSYFDLFYKIFSAVSVSIIVAIALNYLFFLNRFVYSRTFLAYAWALSIFLIALGRLVFSWFSAKLRQLGFGRERLLIVGTGHAARLVYEEVTRFPELGYRVAGFIDVENTNENREKNEIQIGKVLGTLERIGDILRRFKIDELMIALDGVSHAQLLDILSRCEDVPVGIKIYPDTFQLIATNQLAIGDFNGLPIIEIKDVSLQRVNRVLKRALDITVSLGVLISLSWFMLLIAFCVKLTSPGPVFFIQDRVGLDGKRIKVIKFRSMREGVGGTGWTIKDDPRRTRFGAFIRRYSIDELPQFINVLLGEMSVVGPRPEQPQWVAQFAQTVPRYMRRHREKAGITGWAQINGMRGDTSIEERTRYDLYYIENWSLLFDIKIILKTVLAIFQDKNAY